MKYLFLIAATALFAFPAKSQIWDSLRGGLGNAPRIIYADTLDNYLYAAGAFVSVDGKYAKGIARWDGTQWDTLGRGIDGLDTTTGAWPRNTNAIVRYNNELYVGGVFYSVGTVAAQKIARWNGTTWDSLPVQPFRDYSWDAILAMEVINNELYIGGAIDTVCGTPCTGIAKWNGTSWSCLNLPTIMNPSVFVNSICSYNNELYLGGNFYSNAYPNDTLTDIIRFDGSNWKSVGGGMHGLLAGVSSMVVYNGELYVAGYFFAADGNAGNHIQKWNGSTWSDVGGGTSGTNGQIHKLIVHDGRLYAVGVFDIAGGVPASKIASWDGNSWCGTGSTFDNILVSACVYQDSLFIAGGFWTIDGDSISRIAKWIGGNYVDTCGNTTNISELLIDQEVVVYPNPASTTITIEGLSVSSSTTLELYNTQGQCVLRRFGNHPAVQLDIHQLPPGLYSLRILTDNSVATRKVVIQW